MQQFVLVLDGLTVPVKAANLEKLVRQNIDDKSIKVDFIESRIFAEDLTETEKAQLIGLVQKAGFRIVSDNLARWSDIQIKDSLDQQQQQQLDQLINSNSDITQSFIDFTKGSIRLRHSEKFSSIQFVTELNNLGIECHLVERKINDRMRNVRDYCALFGTMMLVTGTVIQSLNGAPEQWVVVPFFVALLFGLWPLMEDGIVSAYLKKRLTYASVIMAFVMICLSQEMWFEAAFVATAYSITLFLERQFFHHIRRRFLAQRQLPQQAWLANDDEAICVSSVSVGDVLRVKAGEIVFADGEIVEGSGNFRCLPLVNTTREVLKPGDEVFAGYRLLEGEVKVCVRRTQENSRWSEFLENVHVSMYSRFPEWLAIRKWTTLFSFICLMLAGAAWWMMEVGVGPQNMNLSMILAMMLISGPVAVTGTTQGRILLSILHLAERGVVVKNGEHFSRLATLKSMFIDKTGVITRGQFKLEEIISMHEQSIKELLRIASSLLDATSKGRYASVLERARNEEIDSLPVSNCFQVDEKGYAGTVDGQNYVLGNYRLMKERGLITPLITERLERWQQDGIDVLFLANEHEVVGMFNIVDRLQEDVALSIDGLSALGVKNQVMLTGDNEVTAEQLAHRMGYDQVKAELSADEKVELLTNYSDTKYAAIVSARSKILSVPEMLRVCVRGLQRNKEQRLSDVLILGNNLQWLPEIVTVSAKTLLQLRNLSIVFITYKLMLIAAVMSGGLALWMTMLIELLFIYGMWLASTREGFLQWINPATQPKSLMQLPPPRKQRIFATGLIR